MAASGQTTASRRGRRGVTAAVLAAATLTAMTSFAPAATAASAARISSPGAVSTWGANDMGQLGIGTTGVKRTRPGPGPSYTDITSIAGGREHVVALRADGSVVAWGRNDFGQVGDGTTTNRPNPVVVALPPVTQVFAGHYHSMALTASGDLYAWGDNETGQLGLGDDVSRSLPVQVPVGAPIATADGGADFSIALGTDGTVWTWGDNSYGEIGDGTRIERDTPVQVAGLSGIVAVAAGRDSAYAVTSSGALYTWGRNDDGQLGLGDTTKRLRPTLVPGISQVQSISAGAFHAVAALADGTVRGWGDNEDGAVGDGTTTNRLTPVVVSGLSGATYVETGRDSSYAITAGGVLHAWGHNDTGQLGDGTTTNRLSPVTITGITGVTQVAAGRDYAAALVPQTDTQPPTVPGTPSAVSSSPGTVTVTWAASTDNVATTIIYSVFRDGGSSAIGTVSSASTGTVSFTDTGLTGGDTHTYQVSASDGTNSSALSPVSNQVTVQSPDTQPPTVPGTPSAVSSSPGTVTVTWAASTDDVATTIIYSVFRDGGSSAIGTVSSASTGTVSFTDTGLTGGDTHTYQVSASDGTNSSALSPVSNQVTVQSPDTQPPTVPGTPSAVSSSPGTVTVTWAASTDDVATTIIYSVFRDGGSSAIGTVSSSSTGTVSFTDTGLAGGSTHTYQVSASDGTNSSALSPVSNQVTVQGAPPPVFSDGFSNGLTGWSSANVAVDQTKFPPDGAAPSLHGATSGAVQWATHTLGGSYSSLCVQAEVDLSSLSTTAVLLRFRSTSAGVARVTVSAAGKLGLRADGSGKTFASTTSLPLGSWHTLKLCSSVGTAATISASLDGTQVLSATSSTGTAPITLLQVGDTAAVTMNINYDNVVVTTN